MPLPTDIGRYLVTRVRDPKKNILLRILLGICLWLLNVGLVMFNILIQTIAFGHPQETISSRTGKVLITMKWREFLLKSENDDLHAEVTMREWAANKLDPESEEQVRWFLICRRETAEKPPHQWEIVVANMLEAIIGAPHFYRKMSFREGRYSDRDRSL